MEKQYAQAVALADKQRELINRTWQYLWKNPETGYKEWKSHAYLKAEFEKLGYTLTEAGDIPGFYTEIDTGRPGPTLLIMAELDALCVASHPDCDPETKAVHACGHCCQSAGLIGVAAALKEPGALDGLCGKIRLMEVPAEEAIEISFREQLRKEGKIRYFGGKQEFVARGMMDGVDLDTMIHSSSGIKSRVSASPGANGFLIKELAFKGRSVHASGPSKGINALYAATQALGAINAIRETLKDDDHIRIHPIITKGGTVVNAIPEEVTVESYVRGATVEAIMAANDRVNRAAAGAALSLGANVTICDRPGYLPRINNTEMCELAIAAANVALGEGSGMLGTKWGSGSSDIGDLSMLYPTAYLHISGAKGSAHGADFDVSNTEALCVDAAKVQMVFVRMLLENGAERAKRIIASYTPLYKTKEEYCAALDAMTRDCDAIAYGEDKTASVKW